MKRRLFNLLAIVSFVLPIAVLAASMTSGAGRLDIGPESCQISFGEKTVAFFRNSGMKDYQDYDQMYGWRWKPPGIHVWADHERQPGPSGEGRMTVLLVEVHIAWVFSLAWILPSLWLIRRIRRENKLPLSLCLTCGYDLRATPDHCPECGAVPTGNISN